MFTIVNNEGGSNMRSIKSIRLTDKKTQVRVEPIGSAEVADWSYGLVRNNMVFLFRTDLVWMFATLNNNIIIFHMIIFSCK